ncbi:hypothetical protein HZA33_00825 [Candidatus Pacearchaeota archaeon]|nr:hypothetical protein [Candidatus Pacearchaeota archaeon]
MKITILVFVLFLALILIFLLQVYQPTAKIIAGDECKWKCSRVGDCSMDTGNVNIEFISDGSGKVIIAGKDSVTVDTEESMDNTARIRFWGALSYKDYQFYFADYDPVSGIPILADKEGKNIHVTEGEKVNQLEYFLVDSGDYGRIMYIEKIAEYPGDIMMLIDVISGQLFTVKLVNDRALLEIDGQSYYILNKSDQFVITWGADANYGKTGEVTKIPKIKLKNGNYIEMATQQKIENEFGIQLSSETKDFPVIVYRQDNDAVLVPVILRVGATRIVLGTPIFISGKCSNVQKKNVSGSYSYALSCQKKYTTSWHLSNCNGNNCKGDDFISCKKIIYILSKEACLANYEISCRQNPNCPEGFEEISRTPC